MKKAWVLSYPLSAQRRLWSDWADTQADLSLRWAHSHFVVLSCRRSKVTPLFANGLVLSTRFMLPKKLIISDSVNSDFKFRLILFRFYIFNIYWAKVLTDHPKNCDNVFVVQYFGMNLGILNEYTIWHQSCATVGIWHSACS